MSEAMIEMKVEQLTTDPFTQLPILILKDESGEEALPLWIGLTEANAIAAELEQIAYARPLPHDLLKTILGEVGMKVDSVELTDVDASTFFATICLRKHGRASKKLIKIDSRPSDAIALAMRCRAPIRVAKKVLDQTRRIDLAEPKRGKKSGAPRATLAPDEPAEALALAELLAGLPDEDFGKWKM